MKKRIAGRKLGRTTAHRWAMLRNMVTSLIEHGRIVTTTPKAKEARKLADKCITLGKKNTLHARRRASNVVQTPAAVVKLFDILGPRYADRQGGYTRVLPLSKRRLGDGSKMSVLEFVDREGELRPARPPPGRLAALKREGYLEADVAEMLTDGTGERLN
eukprot:CAMPEP_0113314610 /NCGR_PEP_ID=MMETSP0010_2-20120614/10597_1 /TAXON_ID=216773 ORGANISM="Corethron hystrix, Strain 308" /NCGR_SAMPLE_ID=MMETSP0010_2 /ASSEMBLY_ACC=CAM_ASM_000155 /LENGTH=159 /DNA_ID=CAMNT_0000170921 /DNA_START=66 /DNA_END=545 /DNA_ORIENTATION=+ /assembly_acc=CAM_ASM_000155